MNDEQILTLYYKRDETALSQTQTKYGRLCRAVTDKILRGSAQDAEECVNDTLLAVWNSIPPARPDNLRAYICKIARNIAVSRLRSNTRLKRAPELSVSLSELDEILPDERVNAAVTDLEIAQSIEKFLRTQPQTTRKVFVLKYCYCYTQKEIAELYSMRIARVNSMLARTRKALRDHLIKEGIEI